MIILEISDLILYALHHEEDYCRKVLPYLSEDFFTDTSQRTLFRTINEYVTTYNTLPSREAISIEVDNQHLVETEHDRTIKKLEEIQEAKDAYKMEWLMAKTEEFGKEAKIFNAMRDGIAIMDGKDRNHDKGEILERLKDALAYSFDSVIGHDYLEDWEKRWDTYRIKESKIPFDLKLLNDITRGGYSKKTLNIWMAGTNVGKTLIMTHLAAAHLEAGYNVLYISAEESEEKIAERIDSNLLDCPIEDVEELPKMLFEKKIAALNAKTKGKLVIKEYPTASAHVGHMRHLLSELELKKDFVPEVLYIDYLNLFTSQRHKDASGGMYAYVGSISQELRGLMGEKNLVGITATQVNREGFTMSDFDLDKTSESFAVPMNADSVYGVVQTQELEDLDQYKILQLKSRYVNKAKMRSFVLGVDKTKMRLYDVEQPAQENIVDLPRNRSGQKKLFEKIKVE